MQTWILEPTWTSLCPPNQPRLPAPTCSGDLGILTATQEQSRRPFGSLEIAAARLKLFIYMGPAWPELEFAFQSQELLHLPGLPAPPSCSDLESRPAALGSMDIAPLEASELPELFQRNKSREMTQRRHLRTWGSAERGKNTEFFWNGSSNCSFPGVKMVNELVNHGIME